MSERTPDHRDAGTVYEPPIVEDLETGQHIDACPAVTGLPPSTPPTAAPRNF
jgi:hypothetical protein